MSVPLQNTRIFKPISDTIEAVTTRRILEKAWNQAGLSADTVLGRPIFIPYRIQAAVLETAARASGMEHLGAVCGERMDYSSLDLYGSYVLSAPTLGAALQRGVGALRYVHSHSTVHLFQQGDHLCLRFDTKLRGVLGARQVNEGMAGLLINLVRHYSGSDWSPDWIELPGPRQPSTAELEDLYGTEVRTGRPHPAIAFNKSLANATFRGERRFGPVDLLRDVGELARVCPPRNVAEATRHAIELRLRHGDPSIEGVAELVGIGVRTLQRRLSCEATSFKECLEEVRIERAKALLSESRLSAEQVAARLGYAETNSFRRAFRRRTGFSPTRFRGL